MPEIKQQERQNFIKLQAGSLQERRAEWRPWKKMGFRVAEPDGITILHEREAIRRRVLHAFEGIDADVFLFGSQVDGSQNPYSDYDVGYDAYDSLPARVRVDLEEELEELPIPGKVDLVDFRNVAEEFSKHALKKVEVWKRKQQNSRFD